LGTDVMVCVGSAGYCQEAMAGAALINVGAYPGQDSPVINGVERDVRLFGFGGPIRVTIGADGLSIQNRTLDGHIFFDGTVSRSIVRTPEGNLAVRTIGEGNNLSWFRRVLNSMAGTTVFAANNRAMQNFMRSQTRGAE